MPGLDQLLATAFLCLLPVSELRGGLPYALAHGWSPWAAVPFCVGVNALAAPAVYVFVGTVHRVLEGWQAYARLFDRVVGRARRKVSGVVERYGTWGLIVFVGIPLPLTGAYTGAIGAWVLGIPFRRASLPILTGVALAGAIVTIVYYLVTTFGIEALRLFIKD